EPAEADEAVRVESLVGAIGNDSRERKLPDAQPTIEIGGASASDHDGVEVSSLGFLERRGCDNEERGDDDWRQYLSQVNLHWCVIPFCNIACSVVPHRVAERHASGAPGSGSGADAG